MLSACYLTALGALFWLLIRRSVDQCEAEDNPRFFCYFARNSEEFIAHFTLVAAVFALASIVLIIGIASGITTPAFLSGVEAFLVQLQRGIRNAGLSTWSTAAILIAVYLIHLVRLPEDADFRRFPRALRFVRKPARTPGMLPKVHTVVYLIALISAAAVFFVSQAGSLTQIVSARVSELAAPAEKKEEYRAEERNIKAPESEETGEALAQHTVDALIDRPGALIQPLETSDKEQEQDRQRALEEEQAGYRKQDVLKRLANFRTKAMDRLKDVELAKKKKSDASASGRVEHRLAVNPYARNQRFARGYGVRPRPAHPYPGPYYYRRGAGQGYLVARQARRPLSPGPAAHSPERRTDSGRVEKKPPSVERLIDAVQSDLQGIQDPLKQDRAIEAAEQLFGKSSSSDPEFVRKVEKFSKEVLPADGATAPLLSSYKAQSPRSESRDAAPVSSHSPAARPPVLVYPWYGRPIYAPGVRPPR